MVANARISLGVAFLKRNLNAVSSAKCLVHAEYDVATQRYLLTKMSFTHTRGIPLNVKTSEQVYPNISEVLKRLSSYVAAKTEEGYSFDSEGMEIMAEPDESWGDFNLEPADAHYAGEMIVTIPVRPSPKAGLVKPTSKLTAASIKSKARNPKHCTIKATKH